MPLIELRPNPLASGVGFSLLELQENYSYLLLFLLSLVPIVLAYRKDDASRGWHLAVVGNVMIILGLLLPARGGELILENAIELLGEEMIVENPRIL
ncbi:MAG: hypothetical protein ACOCX5_02935, partial [Chloroflexota bacterium]